MATIARGQERTYVNEIRRDGVATQKELDDALIQHLAEYYHGSTSGGTPVEPYYYDSIRGRYLAFDTIVSNFYLDGTNRKNQYMYQVPGISSSNIPYVVSGEYCIIGWDFYATTSVDGQIMEILDENAVSQLSISVINSNAVSNTTSDILVTDKKLSVYILNTGIDTPVLKLYLKKTYYPIP